MTAKEYLLEIQKFKRTADALGEKAEALRTEMEGLKAITYDRDRVQVSPTNRVEELMPRLVELEEKYGDAILEYHKAVQIRTQQIAEIGREDYFAILKMRYIDERKDRRRYSFMEIAKHLHLSYDRAIHLHGEALQAFKRKFLSS